MVVKMRCDITSTNTLVRVRTFIGSQRELLFPPILPVSSRVPSKAASYSVPWDEPQLRAVLEEDVASALLGVDPDAVVRDNGARLGWDFELRPSQNAGGGERHERVVRKDRAGLEHCTSEARRRRIERSERGVGGTGRPLGGSECLPPRRRT